jgi:8-oxo-dGTP diphosphatase
MLPPIEIVAALIRDPEGRVLLVRKRGTAAFMQPGGKRDPGEDDVTALIRELDEELGCGVIGETLHRLGEFSAIAANEESREVRAVVYSVAVTGCAAPRGEIDEIAWVDPARPNGLPLAPLTREHVLPLAALSNGCTACGNVL